MNPDILMNFKNGGGAVGYYVSSVALSHIQGAARPAAWLVLDGTLGSTELQQLKAIAPVLTSLSAAQSFSGAPLAYSSGMTGMGFWDQNNRLIVTASNPSASGVSGTMTLRTLTDGSYVARELFTGATVPFTVSGGRATISLALSRWDTQVFAIKPA